MSATAAVHPQTKVDGTAALLAAARRQVAITEAARVAADEAFEKMKEGAAGQQKQKQPQRKPSLQELIDSAVFFEEHFFTSGMRNNATRAAAHAIHEGMAPYDMAKYICSRFEDVYGKVWQCVVAQGGVAGEHVSNRDAACSFRVGGWTVYLWTK